jgi:proline dehydrogenase
MGCRRGLCTAVGLARASLPTAVDFHNPQLAFASRSTADLLRGAAVLAVCSKPWIVRNADRLLGLATVVIGKRATNRLVRETFYAHFVAGESALAIAPKMASLQKHGVGGILDYAAEADMSVSNVSQISELTDNPNQPARVYPYLGEANCDANAAAFHAAVRAVADTTPDGFAAVKVSALGDPKLLERVSDGLVALRNLFRTLDRDGTGRVSAQVFAREWPELFKDFTMEEVRPCEPCPPPPRYSTLTTPGLVASQASQMFQRIDADADGEIDAIDWLKSIPLEDVPALVKKCRNRGALFRSALSPGEVDATERTLERLDAIAARAAHLGVRLMVRARPPAARLLGDRPLGAHLPGARLLGAGGRTPCGYLPFQNGLSFTRFGLTIASPARAYSRTLTPTPAPQLLFKHHSTSTSTSTSQSTR